MSQAIYPAGGGINPKQREISNDVETIVTKKDCKNDPVYDLGMHNFPNKNCVVGGVLEFLCIDV